MKTATTTDGKLVLLNDDGTWTAPTSSASVVDRWKSLQLTPSIVRSFHGLFEKVGVHILDSGEELTCIHRGDRVEITAGIDASSVDFTVKIYSYQAERLASQIQSGHIDELEQFRIARLFFERTPSGRKNILYNPLISNPILRSIIQGKNLIHVYLLSPDSSQEADAPFTMIHVNRRWIVIPGLFGEPQRVFRVSLENAIELQRRLFEGMKASSFGEWLRIARWYTAWRKKVEAPLR